MNKKRFDGLRKEQPSQQPTVVFEELPEQTVILYDENLLERSRTQWQFGDWYSLAQISREVLQHHPDRAKLALLAAAGCLQIGMMAQGKQFIYLAKDWGASKKLVGQILIAGVYNSLGRAAAIGNEQERAIQHFHSSIKMGTPGNDARLLVTARIHQQHEQLGLPFAYTDLLR